MGERAQERRQQARFLCSGRAEIQSLTTAMGARGKVANLSLSGCRLMLEAPQPFERGERVEMTFCVRQLPVRVQGVVRQVRGESRIGVEFTLLTERGKRQLRELIEELAERKRRMALF